MLSRRSLFGLLLLGLVLPRAPAPAEEDTPPLVAAAKRGDLAAVTALLDTGTPPDLHDRHRNTALIFAARDGHLGIARRLLQAGADVNWQDGEQVTPLILASFKNHPVLVRLLLDHGADKTLRDQWHRQALTYALRRGADDPIAAMLMEE